MWLWDAFETKQASYLCCSIHKNAQKAEKLLNALLLPKDLAVIKFETHVKGDNMETKGKSLSGDYAK